MTNDGVRNDDSGPIRAARKGVVIILDGLGDLAIPALDGQTPLEAADTPVMDRLVALGRCGLVDPIEPGMAVSTHVGAGVLMGLSAQDARGLGRGLVEAAGVALPIAPGDIALRCNLATVSERDGTLIVEDRRAGRVDDDSDELLAGLRHVNLGGGVTAAVAAATQHRAVLRLSGTTLSAQISDTDPGDTAVLPAPIARCSSTVSPRTADAVNRFVRGAFDHLSEHPVNRRRVNDGKLPATGLITRSAGELRSLTNRLTAQGLKAAIVSAESTVLGLGRMFGFTLVCDARFTAMTDTDVDAKVAATCSALADHDLVYLHIKGTDICAHDRKPIEKRDFLQRIDAALHPLLEESVVVAICADHSTDSNTGAHTGDPVPSLIYIPGAEADACDRFGERDCRAGGLGRLTSEQYLDRVIDALGID